MSDSNQTLFECLKLNAWEKFFYALSLVAFVIVFIVSLTVSTMPILPVVIAGAVLMVLGGIGTFFRFLYFRSSVHSYDSEVEQQRAAINYYANLHKDRKNQLLREAAVSKEIKSQKREHKEYENAALLEKQFMENKQLSIGDQKNESQKSKKEVVVDDISDDLAEQYRKLSEEIAYIDARITALILKKSKKEESLDEEKGKNFDFKIDRLLIQKGKKEKELKRLEEDNSSLKERLGANSSQHGQKSSNGL